MTYLCARQFPLPLRVPRKRARSVAAAAVAIALSACSAGERHAGVSGDLERGRAHLARYGCGSCHVIAGVPGARGHVGPPLNGIASRAYVGGILPNTTDNMVAWIRQPQRFAPRTAMPELGVLEAEGREMTAYLYTLK